MKKSIYFSALIFLISCSGIKVQPHSEILIGYDFSEFTKEGFMFTPIEYIDPYESIGIVTIYVDPEITREPSKYTKSTYKNYFKYHNFFIEKVTPDEALRAMKEKAVEMGADALTIITIETLERPDINQPNDRKAVEKYSYKISGFAIKRR